MPGGLRGLRPPATFLATLRVDEVSQLYCRGWILSESTRVRLESENRISRFAAQPQPLAVSLRLTVPVPFEDLRLRRRCGGVASIEEETLAGKAEPFRHVLRQSRGLERKRPACNPKVSGTSAASGTLALQSDDADANDFREQPPATAGRFADLLDLAGTPPTRYYAHSYQAQLY
jgi:hypothetical protein